MAVRYLSVDSFKSWARDEVLVDEEHVIEAIEAAEQAIDNEAGRRFVVASTSTQRLFVPPCDPVLRIYDCTAVASVSDNGSTVSASLYQLEPVNGLSASGETVPYDSIRRLGGSWSSSGAGEATIAVTATWGWAAIPSGVKTAARIVTQDVLANRDVRFGLVAVTEAAAFSARENKTVQKALSQYKGYAGIQAA